MKTRQSDKPGKPGKPNKHAGQTDTTMCTHRKDTMHKPRSLYLVGALLCAAFLILSTAAAARPTAGQVTFTSPIVTATLYPTRPPLCPPGETRPDCVPWRPTPPPVTPVGDLPAPLYPTPQPQRIYLPMIAATQ